MSAHCDPEDIALKSFFLGPQAENGPWLMAAITHCLEELFAWRKTVFPEDGPVISAADQSSAEFLRKRAHLTQTLERLMKRFQNEMPKFSPRYIGHMFSETSVPALLGHIVTLLHNPNNISAEASHVGIELEREAIGYLATMFGWSTRTCAGHFTSGGTLANFEALYRARTRLKMIAGGPGPVVLVPENAHYSWQKAVDVFGLGKEALWKVKLNQHYRLSVKDLKLQLERARKAHRPVLMVVTIAGSTELGTVDPIDEVVTLLRRYREKHRASVWHHVDAAYGGFLCAVDPASRLLTPAVNRALRAIAQVDSITVDPHKMGYVPYASGAFLVRHKRDYYVHDVDAPYVDFDKHRDPGPQTLEGSRSAAGAVATWMTANSIGFNPHGYGKIIERTMRTRREMAQKLKKGIGSLSVVGAQDSNILCFYIAKKGESLKFVNRRAGLLYKRFSFHTGSQAPFMISKTELRRGTELFDHVLQKHHLKGDDEKLTLLRLTLMNPFLSSHEAKVNFIDEFVKELSAALVSAPKKALTKTRRADQRPEMTSRSA